MENKIGKFIADYRKANGLTQLEFAKKLNVSNKTLSKWERGASIPDVIMIAALADILGVTTDELLREKVSGNADISSAGDVKASERKKPCAKSVVRVMLILLPIAAFLPLAVTILFLPFFPQTIPAHYNSDGVITRWGSRYENLIFPVLILVFISVFRLCAPLFRKLDVKGAVTVEITIYTVLYISTIGMSIACIFLLLKGYGISIAEYGAPNVDPFQVAGLAVGVVWALLGYLFFLVPQNRIFGLRTRSTLGDKTVWRLAHRYSGLVMIGAGLACITVNLFFSIGYINFYATILPCLVLSMILIGVVHNLVLKKTGYIPE